MKIWKINDDFTNVECIECEPKAVFGDVYITTDNKAFTAYQTKKEALIRFIGRLDDEIMDIEIERNKLRDELKELDK